MTPATLNALADRCEAATGADRELDIAITEAFGWQKRGNWLTGVRWERGGQQLWGIHVPKVTASLDAAMTLVPERYTRNVTLSISPMSVDMGGRDWRAALGGMKNRSGARSFALALCAAALRARAAMMEEER